MLKILTQEWTVIQMAKYILKQEAIFVLANEAKIHNNPVKRAYARAVALIEQITAEDVQPVKHGKWLHINNGIIFCSECEHEAYWDTDYGQQLFDYCPYCGARMDGEQND